MISRAEDWYIALEGNIGAGKTTLAKKLAVDWEAIALLEHFEDNSFLPKFYQEPARYAFPLEMSLLAARFNQLKARLPQSDLFAPRFVADYCLFKSLVFSRITLDDDEYSLFHKMFELIEPQIRKPDLIVYLHRPVNKLLLNIAKRGRDYESDIRPEYLEKVQEGYLEHFRTLEHQAILIIELDGADFEENYVLYGAIKELIVRDYGTGIHKVRL
ncbi:MAG: deoxynucleoside kinase [Bacteroidia bacterium]